MGSLARRPVAIPDFQAFMLPILQTVADGLDHLMRDVTNLFADHFDLSAEERGHILPSGQQTIISNRVAWAKTHLKMAGLLENPTRGYIRISPLGKQVLDKKPARIDVKFLRQFPSYVDFVNKSQPAEQVATEQ